MSETTDSVVGAIPSGYREAALGQWDSDIEAVTTTVYPVVGDPSFVDLEDDYADDSEETKSLPGATEVSIRKTRGKLSRTMRFSTEAFTDFMAWGTGNVTTGVASSAQNESQTVTQTGVTAGAFKVRDTLDGQTSAEILYNDDQATRQTKLEAIFGVGNVTVTYAAEVMTIDFGGSYAATNYPTLELIITQAAVGGDFVLATAQEGQAAGQYVQTIQEPSICDLNPHSFPFVEGLRCGGLVDAFKIYPGCVVNSIGFELSDESYINMAVELLQCGIELPGATFTFAADTVVTRLLGNQVQIWIGDAFTGGFLVGVDELAALSAKFNFNIVEKNRINNLKTVSEYQYPKNGMSIDLSATFKGGKSSRYYQMADACRDGYRPKMRIKVDPLSTPQRPMLLDFNKLKVGATVKPDGREQQTQMALMALSNTTDNGRFTLQTTTAISSYLQLAP